MKFLLIVLALLNIYVAYAQNWSQPINVSNQQNTKNKLDFCIDSSGAIHCVWMGGDPIVYQIYYSRSNDSGLTWSTPLQISDIDVYTRYYPKIVADSSGRLIVTYTCTYEGTETLRLKRFNGMVWSTEQTISASQVNSINLALAIDNCDRVYSFWQVYETPIGYKFNYVVIGEDNTSQIFSPYSGNMGNNLVYSVVADSIGNLHCSGSRRETPNSVVNACYYKYNISNREWIAPVSMMNQYNAYLDGSDVTLSREGLPIMTWREVLNQNPLNDRSQYSQFDGQSWSNPNTISEDPWYQTMVVDANNIVHLVQVEKFYSGSTLIKNLVYYTSDGWEGQIITNSTNIATIPELKLHDNTLFLVYYYSASVGGANDIYVMTRVLPNTSINDALNIEPVTIGSVTAYPNPFRELIDINYRLNNGGLVILDIFNIRGQLVKTLSKEHKTPGNHTVMWNGTNEHGFIVSNGIYYCRIQVGNKVKTTKLFLVK